jgi:hypothetical protein
MLDPTQPRDPTQPYQPVIIARPRPAPVLVAGVLLYLSGAAGILASLALLGAAGGVVDDFRRRAVALGVGTLVAADSAHALRTALLVSGSAALALALLSVVLARGVLRRREAARVGALVVAGASLGCALLRTSVTAFGQNVRWSVAAGHADPLTASAVAQAFGDAMPGWFVGLAGGLTDLQSLGCLAIAVLLVLPLSREYFRTRMLWWANDPTR